MKVVLLFCLLGLSFAYLQCEEGFVPNSNNICIKPEYIEGCFRYASQNICEICDYKYDLDDKGLCSLSDSPKPTCLEENFGYCKSCNVGLSNIDGECKYTKILGCLQKNYANQCINCASGFILVSGICEKGIKNCQSYNQETCLKCRLGFSLVQNLCLKNTILGCKHESDSMCFECFDPFKEVEGHCDIPHCKTFNDFGCDACDCGFFITKNRICEKMQEGCIRYQRGHCTDCYPPFKLKGSTCLIDGCEKFENGECLACKTDYKLENGMCVMENCLEWEDDLCRVCEKGFNYYNGKCFKFGVKMIFK